jgi:transaldolase
MESPPSKAMSDLKIKLFADGADKAAMLELYAEPYIKGFTTNPTLMRKAGITDYERFAREVLAHIADLPISFEVFEDDFEGMYAQGCQIASWAPNVYVKIPITNTKGEPAYEVVRRLSQSGVKVNVTAVMTLQQVAESVKALDGGVSACVSVFAGRIADTGRDPVPLMKAAVEILSVNRSLELIWASPRELLNVFQADSIGCHIITATPDILAKLQLVGKNLAEYSLETVQMFYKDAAASGYSLYSSASA